ncbi:hypothetical protein [Terrimonas alba]|uniref:hypothetical protein n=1 Tax=Terrimonas alba TaxID=3349636 RepID=UPI0035F38940
MLHIIYPQDETTQFLVRIPEIIRSRFGPESIQLTKIYPDEKSHSSSIDFIENLPDESIVLFMGHGEDDCLFGAEGPHFPRKKLIDRANIKIFGNKYLFCLSCYSSLFLKATFRFSNIIHSVGFGSLPTEMSEVENDKRMISQGVNIAVIKSYKNTLVELTAAAFCDMLDYRFPFYEISNYFLLRLNKKISEVILNDKSDKEARILADLLFKMKSEMVII